MLAFVNLTSLTADVSPLFAQKHCAKMREESIKNFKIAPEFVGEGPGNYAIFRIAVPQDKLHLIQWAQFLHAEAISVEPQDLSNLIPDKVIRTGVEQNWNAIAGSLQMLSPDELTDAVENAAIRVFAARPAETKSDDPQVIRDTAYIRGIQERDALTVLKQAGLRDPMEKWDEYDTRRANEIAANSAREDIHDAEYMADDGQEPERQLTFAEQQIAARIQIARQNQESEV
jgi:hypothetical protein